MKPQNLHAQEDRLLDFVYGELPPLEARAVESHLEDCARCSELLADIRGVRTTMAMPMEAAPDAGLESLLAYAQQAARNAAAGPAPKPTWWRRWMLPVASVAAVCFFGILTLQVSKSVNLSPELSMAKSESTRSMEPAPVAMPAPASPAPAQVAPAPPPTADVATPSTRKLEKQGVSDELGMSGQYPEGMTSSLSAADAQQDDAVPMKEASRKKAMVAGTTKPSPDWGNAGAGTGFERAKDDEDGFGTLAEEKNADKKAKSYDDVRRDAVTQSRALLQTKPSKVGSTMGGAPSEPVPAPGAAQPTAAAAPGDADGLVAEANMQQATESKPLRLGGGNRGEAESSDRAAGNDVGDDFDDLMGAKASTAKREQQASSTTTPPPPPQVAAAPMASPPPANSMAPAAPVTRSEAKGKSAGPSSAELSKLADAAFRSGDRIREAQFLRQALESGATGSVRLGLLNRLCDAEFASGRRQSAIEACSLVLEEGPRSGAAQVARKRLASDAPGAGNVKAGAGSKAAKKADSMEAPASAAPTQAH